MRIKYRGWIIDTENFTPGHYSPYQIVARKAWQPLQVYGRIYGYAKTRAAAIENCKANIDHYFAGTS